MTGINPLRKRAIVCAALLATLHGGVARAGDELTLRGCLLTGTTFDAEARELRGTYVPPGYRLGDWAGPGKAALLIWTFSCRNGSVAGDSLGPLDLAIVGIQVQQRPPSYFPSRLIPYVISGVSGDPDRPLSPHPLGNGANLWDIYVVSLLSDAQPVVRQLASWGMPAQRAAMSLEPRGARAFLETWPRTADVSWPDAAVSTSVGPALSDVTHYHDNVLYYGTEPSSAATVTVTIPHATDHACTRTPGCGSASASGWMASFLGGHVRADSSLAFDHDLIDEVRMGRGSR